MSLSAKTCELIPTIFSYSYSSSNTVDWKEKYHDLADTFEEMRAEMEEFQRSSKELEEELERDVDRAEKEKETLRIKLANIELDRDEWKV